MKRSAPAAVTASSPWICALVLLALWLIARPYAGLRHDGILYLGQALLHLRPEVMGADLFFAYGSQDRFTVFSRLLAWLYAQHELPWVQVAVLGLCHGMLLAASWLLLAPLAARERWLGLFALAVVSHQYGGHGIFAFAERFVTARSLAEPLALLTLAALVRGRWAAATLALVLTGLVHPLVAIGAAAVAWCWLVLGDRRWLWSLGLVLLPVAAGLAGVAPLDQLLRRYDAEWWAAVNLASGHLLMLTWHHTDYWTIALDGSVLLLAAWHWQGALARLCKAVALACALLLLASLLAADLGHNQLLTQLQLWRVQWIAHLLAVALLPALVMRSWRESGLGRVQALAWTACAVAIYARWPSGWVFLLAAAGLQVLAQRPDALTPRARGALFWAAAAGLAGLSLAILAGNLDSMVSVNRQATHLQLSLLLATLPTLSLPLAMWLTQAWPGRAMATGMVGLALLLLAYGVANVDRRPMMIRVVENGLHADHPFRAHIPSQAHVLWWKQPAAVWVLLQRASWWSADQGAGLPFNRQTGFESERRRKSLGALEMQEQVCRMTAQLNGGLGDDLTACTPTVEVLTRLCRTEKGPDFLIFERKLDGAVAQWVVNPDSPTPLTWHLYDCTRLR